MKNIITFLLIIYGTRAQRLLYPDDNIFQRPTAQAAVNTDVRYGSQNTKVDELISQGITSLALSVNTLQLDEYNNNIVFSPVSIASALALVLLGSNGRTFEEIAAVMGLQAGVNISARSQEVHEHLGKLFKKLEETSDIEEQVKMAAAIFVQNNFPIRSLYKQTSENIYRNEILNLDFSGNPSHAQNVINAWVSDRTGGKIKNIVPEPPPYDTRVIIVSALYFNGAWEHQFFDGMTRRRPFFPNGRRSQSNIQVDMMSNGGLFPYYKDAALNCEIMGLPYKGNHTTMYIVMPTGSNTLVLRDFEKRITATDLERLVSKTTYQQSVMLFPKMKLETTMNLRSTLQNMGVNALFNPSLANLALLSPGVGSRPLSSTINQLYNNAFNPITPQRNDQDSVLIFSRGGFELNCTEIFDPNSNLSMCEEIDKNTQKQVTYKKFGDKVGRRVTRQVGIDNLDKLRNLLNRDPTNKNAENPGLYADQVLHKVYIDVTETGTEAAAATSISLSRGGDIVSFRVDVPFLFFIRNEETKLILFWGTVYQPTPSYTN